MPYIYLILVYTWYIPRIYQIKASVGDPDARAGPGGIGAPVSQALYYLHAGHLIIWVYLSAALRAAALLPESAGRLVGSSRRTVPTRAGAQSEGP